MDQPLNLNQQEVSRLGRRLRDTLTEYQSQRKNMEEKWVINLRQFLGQYDPHIASNIPEDRSQAYPRLTRVKVMSMVSRLMALLFPTSEKNWGLQASPKPTFDAEALQNAINDWQAENPDAAFSMDQIPRIVGRYAEKAAAAAEVVISDQMKTLGGSTVKDYESLVRNVVFSAVLYSAGVMHGPMTALGTSSEAYMTPEGTIGVRDVEVYEPRFDFVPIWDYYPDLNAQDFDSQDGQFQRHVLSKHQLRKLAEDKSFFGDVIKKYMSSHPDGNWVETTAEQQLKAMSNQPRTTPGKKYEIFSWWGHLTGAELRDEGVNVPDENLTDDFPAVVWMIDDYVIKAAQSPFAEGTQVYHVFVFEEDEVNLLGSGLPPIMRDSQLGAAMAARMVLDNASVAAGPQMEVDTDLLDDRQDLKSMQPFATWYKRGGRLNNNQAVRVLSIDSHVGELMSVFEMFKSIADVETFVSPATGGDIENAPSEPLRTTSGASMILGAAALPFRDIVRNFDKFTVSVIRSLYEWNKKFSKDRSIIGDVQPVGKGATSLIAKEVRAIALDNFANTLRDEETDYVDFKALVKARMAVRDLSVDTLLVSDEEAAARIAARTKAQADAQAQQAALVAAQIEEVRSVAVKNFAQAKKNVDGSQVQAFNAVTAAAEKGVNVEDATRAAQGNPGEIEVVQRNAGNGGA